MAATPVTDPMLGMANETYVDRGGVLRAAPDGYDAEKSYGTQTGPVLAQLAVDDAA